MGSHGEQELVAIPDFDIDRARLAEYSIDAVADMVIWTDSNGRYLSVNKAATRLLGYSAEELRRLRVCDVDPLFDDERWRQHWNELKALGSVRLETINRKKCGTDVWIEVTASHVCFDGVEYNCSIVRDISDRKRIDAELRSLHERICLLSVTDGLTGIANRRRFDEALAAELQRHQRSGSALSVILLDVDAFKSFNDLYGHLAGDACLRRIAETTASIVQRASDLAARFGGEEFACILPDTGADGAWLVAETIRSAIFALAMPHAASAVAPVVTVSLGVITAVSDSEKTVNNILAEADALLYRAKRAGRNQTSAGTC
jgi:diguanylate cyclase (GGDEF)-like protein/PAS domain S-box-containing protein